MPSRTKRRFTSAVERAVALREGEGLRGPAVVLVRRLHVQVARDHEGPLRGILAELAKDYGRQRDLLTVWQSLVA